LEKIRKEIKGKQFRNDTIRPTIDVGKNTLPVTEEKRFWSFGQAKRMPGNRLPRTVLQLEPEATRRMREDPRKDGRMQYDEE